MPKSRPIEEWLRIALNASPEGFALHRIVRDEEGGFQDLEIMFCTPAAAQLASVAPEELVGQRICERFPSHQGTPVWEGYRRVADTGEPMCTETFYKGEGVEGWFETTTVRLEEQCLAVFGEDISARRQASDKLRAAE